MAVPRKFHTKQGSYLFFLRKVVLRKMQPLTEGWPKLSVTRIIIMSGDCPVAYQMQGIYMCSHTHTLTCSYYTAYTVIHIPPPAPPYTHTCRHPYLPTPYNIITCPYYTHTIHIHTPAPPTRYKICTHTLRMFFGLLQKFTLHPFHESTIQ